MNESEILDMYPPYLAYTSMAKSRFWYLYSNKLQRYFSLNYNNIMKFSLPPFYKRNNKKKDYRLPLFVIASNL